VSKVLVTGAAGFIGSHLTEHLVSRGHTVRAFVHYDSRNNWGWLEESEVLKNIDIYSGDIRDFDAVHDALKGCDAVFHLAALIGIPYSYRSPVAYVKTNIEGTYNVLESSLKRSIPRVIVTSTSETYGTAQYIPIDEKHPLVGQSPYSASKIGADQLAVSYYRSFGLPVKIVRPFNTYGPRQSARAVIPTIITQILGGAKEIKLGNTAPTRDLTYVKDTVAGFDAIFESDELTGEVTNIGMGTEISIGDLALLIADIMGARIAIQQDGARLRPANSEVERLYCDNTKITSKTPWAPRYDLKRGLAETIEWLKGHLPLYKPSLYNV
jgi:NAD dependent epimerase/dehydratase